MRVVDEKLWVRERERFVKEFDVENVSDIMWWDT